MGDFKELLVIIIVIKIILAITSPIWFPVYCIVWIFKHNDWDKEEAIYKERHRKEQERMAELNRIFDENRIKNIKHPWPQEKIEELKNKLI